jgi:aconitate hydratase
VAPRDFNSFGSRRGNDRVMVRGTFANVRLRNALAAGKEGDWTRHQPSGDEMRIFDASLRYQAEGTPLIVLAGKEYGSGSSRDWAAKGSLLLGIQAVLAETYERIHRSNLVGMGVLPLQFRPGDSVASLGLDGTEQLDILGLDAGLAPRAELTLRIRARDGSTREVAVIAAVDSVVEIDYYRHGGVLPMVLRQMTA